MKKTVVIKQICFIFVQFRSMLGRTLAAFPTRAFSGLYSSFRGSATYRSSNEMIKQ